MDKKFTVFFSLLANSNLLIKHLLIKFPGTQSKRVWQQLSRGWTGYILSSCTINRLTGNWELGTTAQPPARVGFLTIIICCCCCCWMIKNILRINYMVHSPLVLYPLSTAPCWPALTLLCCSLVASETYMLVTVVYTPLSSMSSFMDCVMRFAVSRAACVQRFLRMQQETHLIAHVWWSVPVLQPTFDNRATGIHTNHTGLGAIPRP